MTHVSKLLSAARAACCLIAVAVYGCTIGPAEITPARTYLLNPEISVRKTIADGAAGNHSTLLISVPKAQPGFDTARMAYLLRPHELNYYAFNQWVDTPGRMLLRLITQAMEAAGLWRAVVQAPSPLRADYRLDCDNLVIEQQFFSPSRVRLGLRVQLVDIKRQIVMGVRNFEVFESSPSEDAYGGVIAANRASAKLLAELTDWIAVVMDEDQPQNQ
jgi:cholesterol transport system auxiliary component